MAQLQLLQADITTIGTEAIVNAANSSLMGGGGVDGAIHRKGGKAILEECMIIRNRQGGCPTGEAVITTAGNLPAHYVIHTVGPVWHGGNNNESALLANCYQNSMKLALDHGIKTIAFPNISTGVYGYPKAKAAAVAVETVRSFEQLQSFDKIVFVCYDTENYALYKELLSV